MQECQQTPGVQRRSLPLTICPSRIDIPPKGFVPNTGEVTVQDVMTDEDKQHIFNLMRDQLLRPTNYDNITHSNYPIKAAWSTLPLYRGRNSECRCVLAVLTSTQQLLIYGRKNRRYKPDEWTEPWELLTDISGAFNKHMLKIWKADGEIANSTTDTDEIPYYEIYRKRLYELAITDFLWLPDWKLDPETKSGDEVKGVFKTYLLTFHASGSACVWKVVVTKTAQPKYLPVVVFKTNIFQNPDEDVVSSAAYIYVTSSFGYLVVGTNKGRLLGFQLQRCTKTKLVKTENGDIGSAKKYKLSNETSLWDEDMIRVEYIRLRSVSVGVADKGTKLILFAVKHPNIIIAIPTSLSCHSATFNEAAFMKVPHGPIVGLAEDPDAQLFVSHEHGIISLVAYDMDSNVLTPIADSHVSIFDPQKTLKKKTIVIGEPVHKLEKKDKQPEVDLKDCEKRLVFQGLAVSPNKTMFCVARTVGMYHDHLQIRKPTQLIFYSLLPQENAWDSVLNIYAENKLSMRAIVDVLVPFRHALRGKASDELYSTLLQWATPLDSKCTEDLRILFWALKLRPKCDPIEWELAAAEKIFNESALRKLQSVDTLHKYRVDVVIDKIIQRRCRSLIKAVLDNKEKYPEIFTLEIEENKQSFDAMYTFLESKKDSSKLDLPPKPSYNKAPSIPSCYWCKGPLEFPIEVDTTSEKLLDEGVDELKLEFDSEKISGFKWNARRHPVKESGIHKPEICILSLLPLEFPYRRCTNCYVACRFNPPFGQQPYCPLCNAMMYPSQPTVALPDPEEEFEIMHPMRGQLAKKTTQSISSSLMSATRTEMVKMEHQDGTSSYVAAETAEPMDVDIDTFFQQPQEVLEEPQPEELYIEDYRHINTELHDQEWTDEAAIAEFGELDEEKDDEASVDEEDEDFLAQSSDDE